MSRPAWAFFILVRERQEKHDAKPWQTVAHAYLDGLARDYRTSTLLRRLKTNHWPACHTYVFMGCRRPTEQYLQPALRMADCLEMITVAWLKHDWHVK